MNPNGQLTTQRNDNKTTTTTKRDTNHVQVLPARWAAISLLDPPLQPHLDQTLDKHTNGPTRLFQVLTACTNATKVTTPTTKTTATPKTKTPITIRTCQTAEAIAEATAVVIAVVRLGRRVLRAPWAPWVLTRVPWDDHPPAARAS